MTTTTYQPPAAVTLPEPMAPGEFDALRRDAEAAADKELSTAFARLNAQVLARIAAQPRVRIVRGGYQGDKGRISGVGAAGGHVITTDSGETLYLAERDIVRLGKE